MSTLMNDRAAARYLNITVGALHRLRCEGRIPTQQVTLTRAMYDSSDLDAFAERTGLQKTYRIGRERITLIYDEVTS